MPRVVILMQENKTPDYYFPTLSLWGADVQNNSTLLSSPPIPDPPHDRNAWVHFKTGDFTAATVQIDNDVVLPFCSWLAKQFTFCDHHFGLGTNSTPGHMLAVGDKHRRSVTRLKVRRPYGISRPSSSTGARRNQLGLFHRR